MDVRVNKNEKKIEWNVGSRTITIHNAHVLYAFKNGKNLLCETGGSLFNWIAQSISLPLPQKYNVLP